MGDKLKVTTVLEGSVRKAGNRLRITAQLIDVKDGYQIWSERFDRTMDDVFAVQDEIASQIAEKLEITFAGKTRQEPENVEAYDLYLKGRHFRLQWPGGLPRALESFEKAIAIDPKLALAHAGLADAYNYLGFYNYLPPKEAFPKARDAARQALAIDDSVADAYLHLAIVHLFHEWDFPSASREIRRALALEPNHPTAFIRRAFYLSFLGRHDEAVAAARRSLALDPLSPDGHHALHEALYLAHRFEETIEACTATIELHPHSGVADRMMAAAYRGLELWEDALRWAEKAAELNPDQVWVATQLGVVYVGCGRTTDARRILAELEERSRHRWVPPLALALLHLKLGEVDTAFEWLERSFQARDFWLVAANVEPWFDGLRSDPRFRDLVKRVGIPEGANSASGSDAD